MGTIVIMQHDLLSKSMKPRFDIPQDRLINLEKLKTKTKPLKAVLKIPSKVSINRKDLAANWDEAF